MELARRGTGLVASYHLLIEIVLLCQKEARKGVFERLDTIGQVDIKKGSAIYLFIVAQVDEVCFANNYR